MGERTISEQLVKYLADAHSIEAQALVQTRRAVSLAGVPALAEAFRRHTSETEGHERDVLAVLRARGGSPASVKELAMRAGGYGFVLFARLQPDTPGKLAAHAYSYESLERASYLMLGLVAERAHDGEVASLASRIAGEEQAMADAVAACFDSTVAASLGQPSAERAQARLNAYLADAHALESQSIALLSGGRRIAGASSLAQALAEHLEQTREHVRLIEGRLRERSSHPSPVKDAAMRLGGLNWGAFFKLHPDTPGKLAAFAYAFEHLEAAGYEQLRRVASLAGDEQTVEVATRILAQEHEAASRVEALFESAVSASLDAVGAAAA